MRLHQNTDNSVTCNDISLPILCSYSLNFVGSKIYVPNPQDRLNRQQKIAASKGLCKDKNEPLTKTLFTSAFKPDNNCTVEEVFDSGESCKLKSNSANTSRRVDPKTSVLSNLSQPFTTVTSKVVSTTMNQAKLEPKEIVTVLKNPVRHKIIYYGDHTIRIGDSFVPEHCDYPNRKRVPTIEIYPKPKTDGSLPNPAVVIRPTIIARSQERLPDDPVVSSAHNFLNPATALSQSKRGKAVTLNGAFQTVMCAKVHTSGVDLKEDYKLDVKVSPGNIVSTDIAYFGDHSDLITTPDTSFCPDNLQFTDSKKSRIIPTVTQRLAINRREKYSFNNNMRFVLDNWPMTDATRDR